MDLRRPIVSDPTAALPAADPVAKLGAAATVMAVAFLSRDPVTPLVLLVGIMAALAGSGMRPRELIRLVLPLLFAAVLLGLLNALLAPIPAGADRDAVAGQRAWIGLALSLRIIVIALSGTLALATTDPADLAAGLVVHLRFPARVAIGALASLRLVPLLGRELETIRLARRARGVEAGRNAAAVVSLALGAVLALLVSAIRHAGRLAMAMDGRGFDSGIPRTVARPPRMRRSDWALLAAAALLALGAVAISVALGTWTFLFG